VTPGAIARGDVVLTRFPFTDLSGASLRPAILVSPGLIGQEVILAAISSVVRGSLAPMDLLVDAAHPEFALTGLRVTSVIRTHQAACVERSVLVRRLGRLGPQLQTEVHQLLRQAVGL